MRLAKNQSWWMFDAPNEPHSLTLWSDGTMLITSPGGLPIQGPAAVRWKSDGQLVLLTNDWGSLTVSLGDLLQLPTGRPS